MEPDGRISAWTINLAVAIALVLGVGFYNLIDTSSDEEPDPRPAATTPSPTTSVPTGTGETGPAATRDATGVFGSAVAALDDGVTADEVIGTGGGGDTVDPTPPSIPACPTDAASDTYETVSGPVGDALGQQLPEDNLRVLAEIAAGCSSEPATTPLIGLALDLGRLVPDTGLAPVDLSAIPAVEAPTLPPAVIDALGPLTTPIQEGCAGVGLLGVLVTVLPGAANVPIHGQDLVDALVPAMTLCAQFEG